ncbi:arsenite efflux transporter metallochaperone ArsD [Acetobacterium bakii]|uniref:Arsenic resistance operon repressor n=1 Tax=Acetobacterium bakii TaxID=52689 RepID=A0A0L6U4F8_9FIRM|nr:arsenite efflux transporter metallochaperone ArsD [Acetobacterium bakii]KNZ43394.1 arsenic resistance operon repressor [Acetobacterium bakii]
MSKIEIYDPAMCCSTGVCGPGVDKELMRVSTLINSLALEGKNIRRYGLSENPQAFVTNKEVNDMILNEGVETLPITVVDGEIKKKGSYPSNQEFATWLDMTKDELVMKLLKAQKSAGCSGDCGSGCSC